MTPSKPKSRLGFLLTILVILLLAAAAYPAWMWWRSRNAPEPVVAVPHKLPKLRNAALPPTGTATSTSSSTTTTTPVGSMASIPPPPATTSVTPQVNTTTTTPVTTTHAAITPTHATIAPPTARAAIIPTTTTHAAVTTHPATATIAPHLERTSNSATITNAPPAAATSDPARAKYDGMARDFAAQTGGSYTVQIELVCETSSVTRALGEAGGKVWFVSTSYHGRPCYRVFWGRYGTSAEASASSKQIPAALGATPVVVKIPR